MSSVATIAVVGSAGSAYSAHKGASGARKAAEAQVQAAQLGVDESRRQFDIMQGFMNPYVTAGTEALEQQQAISGALGPEAQQAAIQGIQNDPYTQSLMQQGEEAILANASATGGLRGGDTQGFLAQYRPQMLNDRIMQQYNMLGGLTNLGQASAAGVGAGALQTGQQVAGLYGEQGAAQAGAYLAQGQAQGQMANQMAGYAMDAIKAKRAGF